MSEENQQLRIGVFGQRRNFSVMIAISIGAMIVTALFLASAGVYWATHESDEVSVERQARSAEHSMEASVDELALQQARSVFGISVDPAVFQGIRTKLENGERPAAGRVDVDALVNYFAGAPVRPPRRPVSLEVEASPAPVEAEGDHAILRFTVDTAKVDVPARGSIPPVATDVRLTIDVDSKTVGTFRRIGGSSEIRRESMLLHNVSVTGLYELSLRPHLQSNARIATVRLTYRAVEDGREHSIERVVRGRDLAGEWSSATRRHRLASLGAVWSETLKGTAVDADIARRAEELATQNPGDTRARELANAASATGGGR